MQYITEISCHGGFQNISFTEHIYGIDSYFPLTDAPQTGYDLDAVLAGWTSGEGYDFYYSDVDRTIQAPLGAAYAWKNIDWWYNNTHTNPDASTTAWTPAMKKIWFTEYGFPSVDGATNQPNVFYDPNSVNGAFPYHSKGRADLRAQRLGITATEAVWKTSTMVERRFLWTWDARPFPYWPDLGSVWTDGGLWPYGHWVQGKLGLSSLGAIVADLCARGGLTDIDVTRLTQPVEGFVVVSLQSIRENIEQLEATFFFDSVESDGVLKFMPRGTGVQASITENDIIPKSKNDDRELLAVTRAQEQELPQKVYVSYFSRLFNYQTGTQLSQRMNTPSRDTLYLHVPVVMSDQYAKTVCVQQLLTSWTERHQYSFDLPAKYARLEPTDVVNVTENGITYTMRITLSQTDGGMSRIKAVGEDISIYDTATTPAPGLGLITDTTPVGPSRLELLDLPAFPGDAPDDAVIRAATNGLLDGWRGAILYRSDDDGANYMRWLDDTKPAIIGSAITALEAGVTQVFDEINSVTITLIGQGELSSASELAVLNGANLALIGSEVLQFKTATFVEPGKYTLSNFLRGRLGTEYAASTHAAGDRFVLLNENLVKDSIAIGAFGLPRYYKPVTIRATLGSTQSQTFIYAANALKPYSPVQIMGSRDGSGNLTISWVRRSRLGGPWIDNTDVPLHELSEKYEIDIMNGMNVVRTLSATTTSAAYSAANQTTDFGSPQASINVNIYQISDRVGRGYAGMASV